MQETFYTVEQKEEYLKSQGYKLSKEPWEETYMLRTNWPYLGHGIFNENEMAGYYPYDYKVSEYINENNEKRYVVEGPQGLVNKSPSKLRYLSNQAKQYLNEKKPGEYEKRLEKVNTEKHLIDYLKDKYQLDLERGDLMFFTDLLPDEKSLDAMIEETEKATRNPRWSGALWEMSCGRLRQMTAVNEMFNGGKKCDEEKWICNAVNQGHSDFITGVAKKFLNNAIERELNKGRYVEFYLCEDEKTKERNGKNYCKRLKANRLEKQGFGKEMANSIIQALKNGKGIAFSERIMKPWKTLKIANRLDDFAKKNGYVFNKNNFLDKYIFDDNIEHNNYVINNHHRNLITSYWVEEIYRTDWRSSLDNNSKEVFFNCLNMGKSLKESLDNTLLHHLENRKRNLTDKRIKEWNEQLYDNWAIGKENKEMRKSEDSNKLISSDVLKINVNNENRSNVAKECCKEFDKLIQKCNDETQEKTTLKSK